ncbi:MAG: 1-(5-phosphoribosyl)-5-[(5-phosphoribosylamino)methylideneamino] imidazole-4-carboxamide isomerase [Acidobacteria bacterium]|nr:1-(5-phosphoribosyl)-5-[(5-phosphoribosylamino)methylideneamino] imidazole-4-carboxamide isomerase [Acidobacteriota bacterium]
MIIACIDLQGGKAVQLVRGRRCALAVDDVLGLLNRFRRYSVLHVIDLDAALCRGTNAGLVRLLCRQSKSKVRVGGGIRSVARAGWMLRWGAEKVIVGSAAFRGGKIHHAFLRRLARRVGRRRIVLALDAERGHIVVRGWRKLLALRPEEVMPQLEPYCAEFLCTCVEKEGAMRGTNLAWFRALRRATRLPITAAGGIRSRREVRALKRLGMNAAIGMALYLDQLR